MKYKLSVIGGALLDAFMQVYLSIKELFSTKKEEIVDKAPTIEDYERFYHK